MCVNLAIVNRGFTPLVKCPPDVNWGIDQPLKKVGADLSHVLFPNHFHRFTSTFVPGVLSFHDSLLSLVDYEPFVPILKMNIMIKNPSSSSIAMSGTDWLELPTVYKAYLLGLNFRKIPITYGQKHGTFTYLHWSWSSHWLYTSD